MSWKSDIYEHGNETQHLATVEVLTIGWMNKYFFIITLFFFCIRCTQCFNVFIYIQILLLFSKYALIHLIIHKVNKTRVKILNITKNVLMPLRNKFGFLPPFISVNLRVLRILHDLIKCIKFLHVVERWIWHYYRKKRQYRVSLYFFIVFKSKFIYTTKLHGFHLGFLTF